MPTCYMVEALLTFGTLLNLWISVQGELKNQSIKTVAWTAWTALSQYYLSACPSRKISIITAVVFGCGGPCRMVGRSDGSPYQNWRQWPLFSCHMPIVHIMPNAMHCKHTALQLIPTSFILSATKCRVKPTVLSSIIKYFYKQALFLWRWSHLHLFGIIDVPPHT